MATISEQIDRLISQKIKTDEDGKKCLSRSLGTVLKEDFYLALAKGARIITCDEKEAEEARV